MNDNILKIIPNFEEIKEEVEFAVFDAKISAPDNDELINHLHTNPLFFKSLEHAIVMCYLAYNDSQLTFGVYPEHYFTDEPTGYFELTATQLVPANQRRGFSVHVIDIHGNKVGTPDSFLTGPLLTGFKLDYGVDYVFIDGNGPKETKVDKGFYKRLSDNCKDRPVKEFVLRDISGADKCQY